LVAIAQEALAAQPEGFDLIVTEHRMPAMSGLDLNRALRKRGVGVPVVLMSSDPDTGGRAKLAGFFEYLAKPLDFSQLQGVLGRVGVQARSAFAASLRPAKTDT
jgi:DNA-binding NtrC family response regulator